MALNRLFHVVCMAHAQRKFDEAVKSRKNRGKAHCNLGLIQKLYQVEKQVWKQTHKSVMPA